MTRGVGPCPREFVTLLFSALLLSWAAPADAWDAGARIGYGKSSGADGSEPSIGLYGRIDLPGPVNLELAADTWKEERSGGAVEAKYLPLQATALLYPLPSVVVKPYLLGGAGIFLVRTAVTEAPGLSRDRDAHLFSLHGGAGLEMPLAGVAGLMTEFRYYLCEELSTGGAGGITEETYRPGGWRFFAGLHLSF